MFDCPSHDRVQASQGVMFCTICGGGWGECEGRAGAVIGGGEGEQRVLKLGDNAGDGKQKPAGDELPSPRSNKATEPMQLVSRPDGKRSPRRCGDGRTGVGDGGMLLDSKTHSSTVERLWTNERIQGRQLRPPGAWTGNNGE